MHTVHSHLLVRTSLLDSADNRSWTVLLNASADGNHVQILNATICKESITNFTANPNVRLEIVVGIGYDDSVAQAQSLA